MDMKTAHYFIAIAEEKSISKAAKRLYLSQPTLSSYLRKLESSVGTPLFYRDKTLSLTPAGDRKDVAKYRFCQLRQAYQK